MGMSFSSKTTIFQSPDVSASAGQSELPKIHVIGTGGTIAGVSKTETSFQDYRAGQLDIQKEMVDKLPNLNEIAEVSTTQFGNKGSSGYSMEDLYDLSLLVDKQLKDNHGVVVTTGTDTMEEIAYFLDLTVRSSKPVVVTGSMRPWTVISDDAKANLFNAIKLAASKKTSRYGTVVMLNDEIYAARDVTKSNSYRLDAFESQVGILGYIDQEHVQMYRGNARVYKNKEEWATPFDLNNISKEDLPKVEIVYSYQNAGGEAIEAFVDSGAKGIVTAGTGAGGVSSEQRKAMNSAIDKGTIFFKTTRADSGSVYRNSKGIIAADNLNPQHARIFLILSLAFSNDYDTIAEWMEKYGSPQIIPDFDNEESEVEIENVKDMREALKGFKNEGQFENADDARLLDNHLAALEKYEKQKNSEKMVKHLDGFKVILDDLKEKGLIGNEAYNKLNSGADILLDKWKNEYALLGTLGTLLG